MRLPILRHVLFNEFPTDNTTKCCIFTRPHLTDVDYSPKAGELLFLCSEPTFHVMSSQKNLPPNLFIILSDQSWSLIKIAKPKFAVCCIPCNVAGSDLILIKIKQNISVYAENFSRCDRALSYPMLTTKIGRINDVYVDNMMAGLAFIGLEQNACENIKQIVTAYAGKEYKIYVNVHIFGFEELLYALASSGLKVGLESSQKRLFRYSGHEDLFEFEGSPDITVFASGIRKNEFTWGGYTRLYRDQKILHIKLIPYVRYLTTDPSRNIQPDGMIIVCYTPHPRKEVLREFLGTLQPKRVHPLIPNGFSADRMTEIPEDILPDGCEVVTDKTFDPSDISDQDLVDVDLSNLSNRYSGDERSERSFLAISSCSSDSSHFVPPHVSNNPSDTSNGRRKKYRKRRKKQSNDQNQKGKNKKSRKSSEDEDKLSVRRSLRLKQNNSPKHPPKNDEIITLDDADDNEEEDRMFDVDE